MLDIRMFREEPDKIRENLRKKFQEEKLPLVDQVIELDRRYREVKSRSDELRGLRNKISKEIGGLYAKGLKAEAEEAKKKVGAMADELASLEAQEGPLADELKALIMQIPNIIDDSVPIGRDDSENVEVERYGEPAEKPFPVPYHVEIMENLQGIDLDSARRTSGNGFYYLKGDVARLHSAILSYARIS
jgi:seryl-tRNA synthetase